MTINHTCRANVEITRLGAGIAISLHLETSLWPMNWCLINVSTTNTGFLLITFLYAIRAAPQNKTEILGTHGANYPKKRPTCTVRFISGGLLAPLKRWSPCQQIKYSFIVFLLPCVYCYFNLILIQYSLNGIGTCNLMHASFFPIDCLILICFLYFCLITDRVLNFKQLNLLNLFF